MLYSVLFLIFFFYIFPQQICEGGELTGELRALAIFSAFPDSSWSYPDGKYWSTKNVDDVVPHELFSDKIPYPEFSIPHYFNQISFGKFTLIVSAIKDTNDSKGWYRSYHSGKYFTDTMKYHYGDFVEEILKKADKDIDFSNYANKQTGIVNFLFIVMPATFDNFICSSGCNISNLSTQRKFFKTNDKLPDGTPVVVDSERGAMVEAKFRTITHEYGHDIWHYHCDNLGPYSIMNPSGRIIDPAPPSAKELIDANWVNEKFPNARLKIINSNISNVKLGDIANVSDTTNPKVIKFIDPITSTYFLITNHQKRGYSDAFRGKGLLIMRGDSKVELAGGNNADLYKDSKTMTVVYKSEYTHDYYKNKIGTDSISAYYKYFGGKTDFFDGINFTEFSPYTKPNTQMNPANPTHLAILNIRKDNTDSTVMCADFYVDYIKPPQNLNAINEKNSVILKWSRDNVFTNTKGHSVEYNVYRSEKEKGEYIKIATVVDTTFTDVDLKNKKRYYYMVNTHCYSKTHSFESGYSDKVFIILKKVHYR